jgi:hypothetical protein
LDPIAKATMEELLRVKKYLPPGTNSHGSSSRISTKALASRSPRSAATAVKGDPEALPRNSRKRRAPA